MEENDWKATREQMRIDKKKIQDACKHPSERRYVLTATDYNLCLDCGFQSPIGGEE